MLISLARRESDDACSSVQPPDPRRKDASMTATHSETAFVLLFRGVGGATQLPTAPLREALVEAGFENVIITSTAATLSFGPTLLGGVISARL